MDDRRATTYDVTEEQRAGRGKSLRGTLGYRMMYVSNDLWPQPPIAYVTSNWIEADPFHECIELK